MSYFLPELQKHLFQEKLPNRWCCCCELKHWVISMQKSSHKRPLGIPWHHIIERQKCGVSFAKPDWHDCIIWKLGQDFLMFGGEALTPCRHGSRLKHLWNRSRNKIESYTRRGWWLSGFFHPLVMLQGSTRESHHVRIIIQMKTRCFPHLHGKASWCRKHVGRTLLINLPISKLYTAEALRCVRHLFAWDHSDNTLESTLSWLPPHTWPE